ncbi:MAG: Fe2+-dependent dioxygenase [Alphaproteobacteria bacterium]|nr:MAG: Fe2+-dependent dioxygenase [Alphaproteobacteria bacterium]
MFKLIEDIVEAPGVAELRKIAAEAKFVDGRVSNPHSKVKNNLQLHEQGVAERAAQILAGGLLSHQEFFDFAFPKAIAPPILTRYEKGMRYGLHPDAAMMQLPTGPLRSDLSCTIFLSDPESYEGGALRLQLGSAELRFKGPAGSAIVYPSTTLHEVEPVTSGTRLVGLTFIQSRIADPALRDILYELNEVAALEGNSIAPENFSRLQAVQYNLMRRWIDAP